MHPITFQNYAVYTGTVDAQASTCVIFYSQLYVREGTLSPTTQLELIDIERILLPSNVTTLKFIDGFLKV